MLQPKKDYCLPMHTAEHILNQTMVRMFNCSRSANAHIEKKKSKVDYYLPNKPTDEQLQEVERRVNAEIRKQLPVTIEFMDKSEAANVADLSKLPEDAGDKVRVIRVGEYDTCACIGLHVENTSEIGVFKLLNYDYEEGRLRLRFKLLNEA